MENILKDLEAAKADLHDIRARIGEYRRDLIRITNTREFYDDPEDFIEALMESIVDGHNDLGTVADDIETSEYGIVNIVEEIEYETLSLKVQGAN